MNPKNTQKAICGENMNKTSVWMMSIDTDKQESVRFTIKNEGIGFIDVAYETITPELKRKILHLLEDPMTKANREDIWRIETDIGEFVVGFNCDGLGLTYNCIAYEDAIFTIGWSLMPAVVSGLFKSLEAVE